MGKRKKIKSHTKIFIGGLIGLFVLFSGVQFSKLQSDYDSTSQANPFLKNISNTKYQEIINTNLDNDSTFFCGVIDKHAIRELVIFKKSPKDKDLTVDFQMNVSPKEGQMSNNDAKVLTFDILNNSVQSNYKGVTYAMFKTSLPIIDIDKIEITEKANKKEKWKATLNNPFDELKNTHENLIQKKASYKSNPYRFLFVKVLKQSEIPHLPYMFSKDPKVSTELTKSIDQYFSYNNLTFAHFKNSDHLWKLINTKDKTLKSKFVFRGTNNLEADGLMENFLKEEIPLESVFDLDKLSVAEAIKNVFTNGCNDDIYFVFNKDSNLIEPFVCIPSCLGGKPNLLKKPKLEDNNFLIKYVQALENISNIDIYKTYIKGDIDFRNELALINSIDPKKVFDYDVLEVNQRLIKKSLHLSGTIYSELVMINREKMVVTLYNPAKFPINVNGLFHKNKEIKLLDSIKQIASFQKDTVIIDLPSNFGNLFVRKKSKTTGFKLHKDIYDLSISLSVSGLNEKHKGSIIPYEQNEPVKEDLFRQKAYVNGHKDLLVNEEEKVISFSKDSVSVSAPLIIPKGYAFLLESGKTVDIIDGGKIVSYSPLLFLGTEVMPIKIHSSDNRGQGILVLSDDKKSNLNHVVFDNLKNPTHGNWSITGAVTFYESPVHLESVSLKNNQCEDALNIVRTNFTMNNVQISNTQSDAFDGDFVKGTITNCKFENLGNDAIDVSGSDLVIKNVIISNAGDKGLSAGEDSKMNIENVEIIDSEIAVAGKDLSVIEAMNLKIINTKLGFTAFQKKPEFGPSKITIDGVTMTGIETKYLIESTSSLYVDNKKVETTQNVKDRMYGAEYGVSSEQTRNNPSQ